MRCCLYIQSRKALCSALTQYYFDYVCSSFHYGISKQLEHRSQETYKIDFKPGSKREYYLSYFRLIQCGKSYINMIKPGFYC